MWVIARGQLGHLHKAVQQVTTTKRLFAQGEGDEYQEHNFGGTEPNIHMELSRVKKLYDFVRELNFLKGFHP